MSENWRDAVGQEIPSQLDMAIAVDGELVAEAEQATAVWIKWQSTKYPVLAAEIARGLLLEETAMAAHERVVKMRRQNARVLGGADLPELTSTRRPYLQMMTDSFSEAVKLPGIKGAPHTRENDAPFWGKPPEVEDYRTQDFIRAEEIRRLRMQVADLGAKNERLREKLSAVAAQK